MTPSTEPVEQELTDDEAVVQVARSVAKSLRAAIEQLTAKVAPSVVSQANKDKMLAAAARLHDSMMLLVKKHETPRILRPNRSVKPFRGIIQ